MAILPASLLVLLAGCGKDRADPGHPGSGTDPTDSGSPFETVPSPLDPWLRDEQDAPGSIRFNEIHYHPRPDPDQEWLELTNPLALDVDLSGWTLAGGVDYAFPDGTVIPSGGYLVVAADPSAVPGALGPLQGTLADGGERIDLLDNSARRIDTVGYGDDDPWPVAADGTGLSLAKVRPDTASDRAEGWTASATLGGTPGAANQLDPSAPPVTLPLVPLDASWAYDLSGAYPTPDWAAPELDDSGWDRADAIFYAGAAAGDTAATLTVTADNYYAAWLGTADGGDLRRIAEDVDGLWYTVDRFGIDVGPLDHLYLAAWESPADYGGPQMAIAEVVFADDVVGTDADRFEWVLGPTDGCPGVTPPDPPPSEDTIAALVADAESLGAWEAPAVDADRTSAPWGDSVGGSFDADTRFVWADTFSDTSVTNTENTYVLLRSREPLVGARGTTELPVIPTTTTFRTTFTFDGDPAAAALTLECRLDDGAVVYLNGAEILRENLPAGPIEADTLANTPVDWTPLYAAVSADALVRGDNVLAVELHQAQPDDPDLTFGCALTATLAATDTRAEVLLDEVAAAGPSPFWLDLFGAADGESELGGLVLASSSGAEQVLPAGTVPTGGRFTLDEVAFPVAAGDVVYLTSADRGRVLDAVRVASVARAREGDGGPWRYPTTPTPGAENLVERVEDVVIAEIQYHHAPTSRAGEPFAEVAEEWIELTNRGADAVDLGGWQLVDAVSFTFPAGTTLDPGERLVVTSDAATLGAEHPDIVVLGDFDGSLGDAGDRVLLRDARGNPADEVRYFDGGRWPTAADGGGSTLELRDVRADNAAPEAWAASVESDRTAWAVYTWRGEATPSAVGPDGVWQELVLGLLDAGEVLVDDVHVIADPDGAAVEQVQNGGFDAGGDHWRLLGNHRHGEVVPDPDDPANPVLRLVATGPTGHMHNHVETTLVQPITSTSYEVSFRARWVSGSNQLNSRLYFNRLPHTTLVDTPSESGTPGAANSTAVADLGPTFADLDQDLAVPEPYQPVRIGVTVSDPDGVAAVRLHTSVDGGAFVDVPMVEGSAGHWEATIDGEAGGSVVQLYVDAEDALGATSRFPAAGPDSRVLLTWDDGHAATNGLHNLRILLTPSDDAWLHEDVNLMSDDLVGATVIADESRVYRDVGVRVKGSERGRPEVARLGYAVAFSREEPFRGTQSSVLVDRSEGVGFGQREVLMNLVMTHAGSVSGEYNDLIQLLTARPEYTGPAELQLDRTTNLMLGAQFEDGAAGSLYEYELIYFPLTTDDGTAEGLKLPQPDSVVGTDLTDLGDDPEAYRWTFLLQNNERRDDYAPLVTLARTFALPDTDLLTRADEVIDVDQWLRAFAFATLSGAVDNYGGDGSQHNARFYARPEDGRMLYFPHDLDFVGGPTGALVGNADLARLLRRPSWLRAYYGHLNDIIALAYNQDWLGPWCTRLGVLLPGQDFAGHCRFVGDRADWVLYGASDAVMTRFPALPFRITTGDGADLEVDGTTVTLDGEAWIDVRDVTVAGTAGPLALTWVDATHWSTTVALSSGRNELVLVATDLHGVEVGSDSIVVTSGG